MQAKHGMTVFRQATMYATADSRKQEQIGFLKRDFAAGGDPTRYRHCLHASAKKYRPLITRMHMTRILSGSAYGFLHFEVVHNKTTADVLN